VNAVLRVLSVLGLIVAIACAVGLLSRWCRGESDTSGKPGVVAAEDANLRELWAHASVNDSWCDIAMRAYGYCWGYSSWDEFKDIVSRHPRAQVEKGWQQALRKVVSARIGFVAPEASYHGPLCRHYRARRVWESKKESEARCTPAGDEWEKWE